MNLNVPTPETAVFEETLCDLATRPLPYSRQAEALHILKLSLLDWLSVATAGLDEPVSKIVREAALRDGGAEDASILGDQVRLPARSAALVNGTTSHALDYDDTHFVYLGHPSVAVLPAALAVAERLGAHGKSFLESALAGVEAACRVGEWLGRPHYEAGFHQTATSGTFGATIACARLLGLSTEQTSHAIGLASTKASGLKSQFGTMGKPYHAGLAAANGVESALLAEAGFVSNPLGLSGSQGFRQTHAGSPVFGGDSKTEYLFETVQHKFHACCHGTHAMLEALAKLKQEHLLALEDVSTLNVTVHPRFLKVCNIPSPETGLEAKFSFRQTAAMSLAGIDTSALESFTDEVCAEPRLVEFRDRVTVSTDPGLLDGQTQIELRTSSGEALNAHHDIDGELPTPERELKVRSKARALLGESKADDIWDRIADLENQSVPVSLNGLLGG